MSFQQAVGGKRRYRRRIHEIALEPDESAYEISIVVHVDGVATHKLGTKQKGEPLRWTELCLPCDVTDTSSLTLQIAEVHPFRPRDRVGRAECRMSQIADQNAASIGCDNGMFQVQVRFVDEDTAKRAYTEALSKVQRMESQPGLLGRTGRAGHAFKALLGFGSIMAKLDPTGSAKVVFSACTKAWEHLEQQERQDAELNELANSLSQMIPSVDSVKDLAGENLRETATDMLNLIEDASLFILSCRPRGSLRRAWIRVVSSDVQEEAQAYIVRFEQLSKEFDRRVNVQVLVVQELERTNATLRELKPVNLAGYDPSRRCVAGTRIYVIDRLAGWARRSDPGPGLAWLHGPAGFGKSSIATSVCLDLNEERALASSFFCKRDSPELRDPRRVLATIAYGLALRYDPYKVAAVAAIREDPELHSRHLQPLYDALLGKPLQTLARRSWPSSILVILVDALDECGDTTTRRQLLVALRSLSRLVPWLKVVLTSRPDADIQEFFAGTDPGWFTEYDVLQYDASADIRIFVRYQTRSVTIFQDETNDAVDQISRQANGLFIWAHTACKFIVDGYDRLERLQLVLARPEMADIDSLYATALKASALDSGKDNMRRLQQCLGAVVVTATRTPLTVASLASLLHGRVSQEVLERVLRSLSSVLYKDQTLDGAIRVSHPSFMDYITDRSRSGELCVDLEEQNAILAECCFSVMAGSLKFNICGLMTSDMLNSEVPDMDERVRVAIRPHLRYSCLYWSSHVAEAQVGALDGCMRRFLFGKELLCWIEVLSLLGMLSVGLSSLLKLVDSCNSDRVQDCRVAANDAYRFVISFYDAISRSTPHLYISALAFAPISSGIAQRMRMFFPKLLLVEQGSEEEWTPCLRSIGASSRVWSVAYSPDGRRIVSGFEDGTAQVWDAETGEAVLQLLTGQLHGVRTVAFSPDDRWIACGSHSGMIRIWDSITGEAMGEPFQGDYGQVLAIVFSADGHRVASCSSSGTVRTLDWRAGDCILEFRGRSDNVQSAAFSPDGQWIAFSSDVKLDIWDAQAGQPVLQTLTSHSDDIVSVTVSPDRNRIVSGSGDKTVRIWDAQTGNALLEPLCGHSDLVVSIAFSPDNRLVVSGSTDRTVRIWDAQTGAAICQPLDGHSHAVYSVAFSPDGRRVVSGSLDKTIRVWEITYEGGTGSLRGFTTSQGHSDLVRSVAFSSNNRRVASGSSDNTVRIWDTETGAMVLGPLEGHTSAVYSVGFSSDGRQVVSGSQDGTVRIWDAETGNSVLEPLTGHSATVSSVAFSPDCRLIVSGSYDKTVRIWDAKTGEVVRGPSAGHTSTVRSVAFSPDGRRIASGSDDDTVRIWDAETGQPALGPLTDHEREVCSVAFSPDGSRLVSGSCDKTIRIWDAEDGHPVLDPLRGHEGKVQSVAFSPDGRWIASGSDDMTVRIWSAETGEAAHELLRGHSSFVTSVAFSPDGHRIVSGAWDMTVRIWDAELYIASCSQATKLLPGTNVRLLSRRTESDKLLAYSSQLARHMHPDFAGWVVSTDGKPVVWLPPEMREIDDSLLCILHAQILRPTIIDLTKFIHGDSWTSIADL